MKVKRKSDKKILEIKKIFLTDGSIIYQYKKGDRVKIIKKEDFFIIED